MEFNEIKTYLDENKDNEEVKTFLDGFRVQPTLEVFKNKLNDADFKSFMDSEKDKHLTKGIETFKNNNLQKLIDEEIKKRFPATDPKDIELENLKLEIQKMQQETARKELTNKAMKLATEKNIPLSLVDFLVSNDEESTMKNLESVESVFNTHLEVLVAERLKSGSYTPPKTDPKSGEITKEEFSKMGYSDRIKLFNENPELYKKLNE